jgi:glutathione synthase/RimK-type ligase-like ATP-grasp enzyme
VQVAVKTLYSPGVELRGEDGKKLNIALYTRLLRTEEVLAGIDQVANCPFTLQDYIEKDFELRITVVGEKVFACRMDTQKSSKSKEDFRRYDLDNTPHTAFTLPLDIEDRCRLLTRRLGLYFGAIDMIVDPKGSYHFLELNPNGQWLWTEDLAGLPISFAVADLLINPPVSQ